MSKICNNEVKVSFGMELNDKDYCIGLLSILKDMEKNYCIAMTEASNEWLYSKYRDIFLEIASLQRELYILMFRRGWYVMESVSGTKIGEKNGLLTSQYDGLEG